MVVVKGLSRPIPIPIPTPTPTLCCYLSSASATKPNSISKSSFPFFQSLPLKIPPIYPNKNLTLYFNTTPLTFFPKFYPRNSFIRRATEEDILEVVANSDGDDKSLPAVRTYENDLSSLTLVGAVDFDQALRAAAADGGEAAAEHAAAGMRAMVVETVFPGSSDDHSTVSTRLLILSCTGLLGMDMICISFVTSQYTFLPVRKVKEKAKKLRNSLTEDIMSSTMPRNILAMTFRQVVLQQLWNFELVLFRPGTQRSMEDLENPREVFASIILSSSDEQVISLLAEVVCLAALESTEGHSLDDSLGRVSNNPFRLFHKPKRILSKDSSVILSKLLEDEILGNAKSLLEKFGSEKRNHNSMATKSIYKWWATSVYAKLEKIGGPEFAAWVSEYVPAYRLQIDSDKLENVKFEGWKKSAENRWEGLLTHSQMVSLANILDMYYEDMFTLPYKQLACGAVAKSTNLSINKRGFSLLKMLSGIFVASFVIVTITVLGQLYLPHLRNGKKYPGEDRSLQLSSMECIHHEAVDSTKLEEFCVSVVERIKESFGWPGEIMTDGAGGGAWTGVLPEYLRSEAEADSSSVDMSSASAPLERSDEETKASAEDIASYQVILSADNKIVGFQPTSRVGVNLWAANPLAKELYGGKKLSPGFIEPGLKISRPSEVVVLELLMSIDGDSYFAWARPYKSSLTGIASEEIATQASYSTILLVLEIKIAFKLEEKRTMNLVLQWYPSSASENIVFLLCFAGTSSRPRTFKQEEAEAEEDERSEEESEEETEVEKTTELSRRERTLDVFCSVFSSTRRSLRCREMVVALSVTTARERLALIRQQRAEAAKKRDEEKAGERQSSEIILKQWEFAFDLSLLSHSLLEPRVEVLFLFFLIP
ncbi:hypothetical protein LguiB_004937 [Lonicera macranthoides]